MDRSEAEPLVTVEPYDHPSGGWGSLKSVTEKTLAEGLAVNTMLQMLTKQNKPDGFACVSCSWAKPADPHPPSFAKAAPRPPPGK